MNNVKQHQNWLATRKWPPCRARWLASEATKDFIEKYRSCRKGYSTGANIVPLAIPEHYEFYEDEEDSDVEQDDAFTDMSIFDSVEDVKLQIILQQLENWRRAYRLFRTGSSRGAEGEINRLATAFTKEHFRLLPVAQLATYLAESARTAAKDFIPARECTFHLHIGGGRLGCGLVLPMLCASNAPFAVLQVVTRKQAGNRPTKPSPSPRRSPSKPPTHHRTIRGSEWVPVMERKDRNFVLPFTINGEDLCQLRVVRDMEELLATGFVQLTAQEPPAEHTASSIAASYRLNPPPRGTVEALRCRLLVLDVTLQDLFLSQSDAISTALGPGLAPVSKHLAELLPPNSGLERVAVYCCENDHKAVSAVRPTLADCVNVRECMVDRICSDRIVEPDLVTVVAEPYPGEIVVTARDPFSIRPAFGSPQVHLPTSSAAYSYLYSRKVLLVNGSHTTLAFMTLRRYCPSAAEAPGDYELLTPSGLTAEEQTELRAWLAARCLVLLHSNESEIMRGVHNVNSEAALVRELWAFAMRTIRRFDTVKDTTKRVLGGGVANRYETRLKDVLMTLETFDRYVPLAALLLEAAGWTSVREITTQLKRLVDDAAKFIA